MIADIPGNSTDSFILSSGRRFLARGKGSSTQSVSDVSTLMDVQPFNVIIMMLILIIGGFAKILYFLRIFDDYGFIVEMVGETIVQLIPFSSYFIMWILLFTVLFQTLQVEIPPDSYPNLTSIYRYILQTYSNSIGNIAPPVYKSWERSLNNTDISNLEYLQKHTIIGLIWGVWLFNQFLLLIIMLNFLIAVISQVYADVVEKQEAFLYQHRASLNHDFLMLSKFSNKCEPFCVLVLSLDKDDRT